MSQTALCCIEYEAWKEREGLAEPMLISRKIEIGNHSLNYNIMYILVIYMCPRKHNQGTVLMSIMYLIYLYI